MNYKHILYICFSALMALALMYLDTKLLDNPKTKATYIKGMGMSAIVTWALLYFLDGGSSRGASMQFLPGINEEILTGPPEF